MSAIADYEIGRNHSKWFDGYVDSENGQIISIDYCHAFVDWLAMHAGLPKERVPNTRNCNEAVIKWITSLGGVGSAFWFKSAEQKTRFRTNNLSAVGELIGNELTDAELQFTPIKGDFVYFRWTSTGGEPTPESISVSHVGWLGAWSMDNIFTYEGNTTDAYGNEGVVAYKSHPINDVQIVGYARPNYSV